MKKLSIFLFFLFNFFGASAAHIVGGSISYEHLSGNEYKVYIEVLRDCNGGGAEFDELARLGIFNASGEYLNTLYFPYSGTSELISVNDPTNICSFPLPICIERTIYEGTVVLPSNSESYTLSYQRCCRTQLLTNIIDPGEVGMTFSTSIDTILENTTPIFTKDVPFAVFAETAFVYDGSATDPDGDSLVYELTTPLVGGSLNNVRPDPPLAPPYDPVSFILPTYFVGNMLGGNYPLTINSETGEMVAVPPFLGVFQIGYLVKEFRNGTLIGSTQREFIFYVTPFENGHNYSVNGQVLLENGNPLDVGSVQIIERNVSNDSLSVFSEQPINANGEYAFQEIPPGVFYVKAVVDPSSIYYDEYIPTYYNNAQFWYSADPINQCDTAAQYRDIFLIPTGGPLGPNSFDGNVISIETGEPVANLSLNLAAEDGTPIQNRTTDATGYFKFENLPDGTYSIFGDLSNSSLLNEFPPEVEFPINNPVIINLLEDRLSIDGSTSVGNLNNTLPYKVMAFPNPAQNELNITLNIDEQDLITINLYNTQGQLISQNLKPEVVASGLYNQTIQLENQPTGVYFL